MGLPINEHHIVYRWVHPDCKILFSVARLGEGGCSAHFASDKQGLRHLKEAIEEWCNFLFEKYEWCTMILAKTIEPSVGRLITKCGFEHVVDYNHIKAYARYRDGWSS